MHIDRFSGNPLISPAQVKPLLPGAEVFCSFNPGACEYRGGVLLLLRVAERPRQEPGYVSTFVLDPKKDYAHITRMRVKLSDPDLKYTDPRFFTYRGVIYLTSISYLRAARSADGEHFTLDDAALLFPSGRSEEYGCEDPRITRIGDTYHINYSAISLTGITTKHATTKDFKTVKRGGIWFCPDNKDVALFPGKAGGRYVALHRPSSSFGGNTIWIAFSPDLKHWGDHQFLIGPRRGMWDSARVGAGHHPILTREGWLELYHGADAHDTYCLAGLLLDAKNPTKVLARSKKPLVVPAAPYEEEGLMHKIVFSNGMVARGDELLVYYGAADTVTCGMRLSVREILATFGCR